MNGEVSTNVVKVYLPRDCLDSQSGYLLGCYAKEENVCCITSITHQLDTQAFLSQMLKGSAVYPVGVLLNEDQGDIRSTRKLINGSSVSRDINCWFELKMSRDALECTIYDPVNLCTVETEVIIVLYDSQNIVKSPFLMQEALYRNCGLHNVKSKSQPHKPKSSIEILAETLLMHSECSGDVENSSSISFVKPSRFCRTFPGCSSCEKQDNGIPQISLCQNKILKWLLETPAFISQVKNKYQTLAAVSRKKTSTPLDSFRWRSFVVTSIVDVLLGVAVMLWIMQGDRTQLMASKLMDWAQDIASELQRLLKWMMGSPAGLKLNKQLDEFLGRFFLYHIYLWTEYLRFVKPVLGMVLWYISTTGCLGLTVQVSLVQDLLSLMTLHIYCFYVYAARLYSLQRYALGSLWRLFRGKKWNVLRQRVDSASYDVDQLFIGTILFTVLLFILPTTALYYIVFLLLRLLVLIIQGILYRVQYMLNQLQVYPWVLWFVRSRTIGGHATFVIQHHYTQRQLVLLMQIERLTLSELWQKCRYNGTGPKQNTWSSLSKKILYGELIYPWINPHKHEKQD